MAYRIEYSPVAEKTISKLDGHIAKRILDDIERLPIDPQPDGCKKLRESEYFRIKCGPGKNYRAIYKIEDDRLLVLVLHVGDRKDVYRALS